MTSRLPEYLSGASNTNERLIIVIGGELRIFDNNRELKKIGLKHSRATDNDDPIPEYQPIG
jgi:hypothetical protein